MADKRFDYDVTALGLETGLFAGWVQPEGDTYVITCKCGTGARRLDAAVMAAAKFDIEDYTEKNLWAEHEKTFPECPHRPAYVAAKEKGSYKQRAVFGMVADKLFGNA